MVETIQKNYGLHDEKVFEAMLQVPREMFMPTEYRDMAYDDAPVPIGFGQTISQPYTVAFMLHLLDLKEGDVLLDIGTGSGYQAAVASLLCKKVYSVEIIEELAVVAEAKLKELGFENVEVKNGQGEEGWLEYAPFDAMVAAAEIKNGAPEKILNQLKVGGRFVAPINGELTRIVKKKSDEYETKKFGAFKFVPFVKENP